jgi:hypothetical protein
MDNDESRALSLFYGLVEEGKGLKYALENRHLDRGVKIRRKSETEFLISIERHPHLFGRESVGRMSSAFATVEQTFSVNLRTRELHFEKEEIQGFEIDYDALAEEDFPIETGGIDLYLDEHAKIKLAKLESEKEVRFFAKEIFDGLDFGSTNKDIYASDFELPSDFMEKMLEAQKEFFIDGLVENWNSGV